MFFHGESDLTVNVKNGHQVLTQWSITNDYADDGIVNKSITDHSYYTKIGKVDNGYAYTQSQYFDAKKRLVMEKWIISEMTHKWSGGNASGSYTDPKGPKASLEMVRFFNQFTLKEGPRGQVP